MGWCSKSQRLPPFYVSACETRYTGVDIFAEELPITKGTECCGDRGEGVVRWSCGEVSTPIKDW